MSIWAIVPAAGIGQRMAADVPKQYLPLAGKPILEHSVEKLLAVPGLTSVVVVLHPDDRSFNTLNLDPGLVETTTGGAERQESVLNGLLHLQDRAGEDDWVLVHDAVRPCVLTSDIEKLLGLVEDQQAGGVLAMAQDNTLKKADADNLITTTVDRSNLWQAMTPQVFRYGILKQALLDARDKHLVFTDEASAVEALGLRPLLVEGDRNNVKITRLADLKLAEMILQTGVPQQ